MCRTVHALLQTLLCGVQLMVRMLMTTILMAENLLRMILQSIYNFASFLVQSLSLIPICIVFMITARLKCFLCSGGGNCPVNRQGSCDCIISALVVIFLFMTFRSTGILDKIFYKFGYVKARPPQNLMRMPPEVNRMPPRGLREPQNNKNEETEMAMIYDMREIENNTTTAMKNDTIPMKNDQMSKEDGKAPKEDDNTRKKNDKTPKENDKTTKETLKIETITETTTETLKVETKAEQTWTTKNYIAADSNKDSTKRSLLCGGSSKNSSKSDNIDYFTTISWTTILYYLV